MIIRKEIDLRNFEFWSGAADRTKFLTDEDWDMIEPMLDELYPDGEDETSINDIFWFDFDTIAKWLGFDGEEHFFNVREHGNCFDKDEMADEIKRRYPDYNEDAIDEWCEDHYCNRDSDDENCENFVEWYKETYAIGVEQWIDMVYELSDGTVEQMKEFISDKELGEKTAEEWVEEFNEWLEEQDYDEK